MADATAGGMVIIDGTITGATFQMITAATMGVVTVPKLTGGKPVTAATGIIIETGTAVTMVTVNPGGTKI